MDLEPGKHYKIIFLNGSQIAGELMDVKRLGSEVYGLMTTAAV